MSVTNIVRAVVKLGSNYTVTAPIVKEDYGLVLQIEGIELPPTYQVDFSNSENNGTSVTMIGNADGVLIPHQFIDTGKDIFAFLYHVGADFGRTVYKFRIPNKVRPDRTNEQPTPEEQSVIDQTIAVLNEAVESTQEAQEAIENMSVSATTLAEGSSATVTKTESEGVVHLEFGIPKGQTGDTPNITASKTGKTTFIYVDDSEIAQIEDGTDGTNGIDGYSPTASVSKSGKTATITITDKTGTTSAQVEDGTDGTDGISPTVTITPITGGHRITITDADGEHSADVMDGTGSVDDVQINGTSIVENGVANVPVGDTNNYGVLRLTSISGMELYQNKLRIFGADIGLIKNPFAFAGAGFRPIVPTHQHESTFYGLAKSAGDTTQSQSSNAVGQYTDEAKTKIKKMIGANDEFELIRCITLDEDKQTVIIDADESSSPFSLQGFMVAVYSVGAVGATSEGYLKFALNGTSHGTNRIADLVGGTRRENGSTSVAVYGAAIKGFGHFTASCKLDNMQIVNQQGEIIRTIWSGMNIFTALTDQKEITSVLVGTDNANNKMGTGSIIALYGIRA